MDTVYVKNNVLHYIFEVTVNSTFANLYNLNQMTYRPDAMREAAAALLKALGFSEYTLKTNDYLSIVLDFLGNKKTDYCFTKH